MRWGVAVDIDGADEVADEHMHFRIGGLVQLKLGLMPTKPVAPAPVLPSWPNP